MGKRHLMSKRRFDVSVNKKNTTCKIQLSYSEMVETKPNTPEKQRNLIWARLFKTNDVVGKRFVKISIINI